jgi:hypothetical protein
MRSTKNIFTFLGGLSLVPVTAFLLSLSSCGGDGGDDPDPKDPELTQGEKVVASLVKSSWKVASVTVDGADQLNLFTDFTIQFSPSSSSNGKPSFSGSYSTTKGGPVWPSSGNWTIGDVNAAGSFQRSDGITVTLSQVTETSLKMTLTWSKNTFGPGRSESIKGQHVFTMSK